jgi:biopolymer transport protein TolQ
MPTLPEQGLRNIIPLLAELGTAIQLVVLAALLLASIGCWGIIFHKARLFRRIRRDGDLFLRAFRTGQDLAFIAAAARRFALSPLARMFRAVHQQLESSSNGQRAGSEHAVAGAVALSHEYLRHLLQRARVEEVHRVERGLPFLATTAGVAPFVGLLGTVWGIMQSFHAIGKGGGATLAVVGPGISEALVATAAGLAAAIPAVVAYNHYLNRLRRLEAELENFTEELALTFASPVVQDGQRQSGRTSLPRSQGR